MGRIIKKRNRRYAAEQNGSVVELADGARPYLWLCGDSRASSWVLTGRATLRALAHAILEAYPDEPKKGQRR